ncbi:hypothetical protein F7230_02915 [Corynebacterium sp. 320]|uniref:DUF5808 domain-containing protein n=1 Tax=Corynebacterium TaxID=1716 RepID=UPI00125CC62A|nr:MULTISPECIES: DUF5808 domain-containing protein [Corynebacterium]KAB1504063.1 hypothetical protein F7230_02915 [Corynebacterium sp. 320]KAB1552838.1 hypothetical protein F7233_03680 [Corynebacterium sp. 321]KAB1553944.1 hypothetical protein F7232_02905 [Corynebacterium sp. 319]KAB3528199.1 hypothetical protein F8354_02915 [Corynebacterium sp. 250]KAB3540313.1 hypothetical protein F8390_03425 [Corynebacterium sp. 366]
MAVLQVVTVLPGFDAWLPTAFTSLIVVSLVSVVALIAADPAVFVDKRFGTGVDFNYASWQGKVFLGLIVLVVAASIALPLLI